MKSSIIFVLLPLILVFVLPSTKADVVSFAARFQCYLSLQPTNYCFMLRYKEADDLVDDRINTGEVNCGGSEYFSIQETFDGGDGPFNYYYEFYVEITHNCTYDGRINYIRYDFDDILIADPDKKFYYEMNLTNRGETVSMYDGFPNRYPMLQPMRKMARTTPQPNVVAGINNEK